MNPSTTLLDHAIWWHVYPLGATGAPVRDRTPAASGQAAPDAGHRLNRLLNWLDYAVELGCSGLLLGPIFESVGHGYDTLDHFRIDGRLGDDADFDALIAGCRERGLVVMLDGVFNHVATTHPAVAQGLAGSTVWEGHESLATLHHDDPRVVDLVADVMLHWLRRGIAGWRLDVAYSVPPEFWRAVLPRVRAEFPDAVFLGEVIHGDYVGIAQAGGLDSVTQYELWKGLWSSIHDRNFWELAHALERHQTFSEAMITNTFIGNHDVDRIASTVGAEGEVLALAVLMTVPGMPSVYYGDEQGFTGVRGEGFAADDAIRPALPETPAELAPYGQWLYRAHQELIGLRRRHPWLTRGRLEVLDKTNETLSFWVRPGGGIDAQPIQVDLWLDPRPGVRVHSGGETLFSWSAA